MHDKLIMILNNGAAHENYGQASKMNLDIILTRWIVLDRECLFGMRHNFPDVEYRKYFDGFLELTCKNENRLMKNVNKILDYSELR